MTFLFLTAHSMSEDYILIIPSWYPEDEKPNNGIFIRKHVDAISTFDNVKVLFATEGLQSTVKLKRRGSSIEELIISYASSASQTWNQFLLIYTFYKGYKILKRKYG